MVVEKSGTETLFSALAQSKFRSSFCLKPKDVEYIDRIGIEKIRSHAYDFVRERLAPTEPKDDGRQTPMRGHPVFIAQHACACCCRGCLEKWHKIPKGRALTRDEVDYVVDVIMCWIKNEYDKRNDSAKAES